MSSEKFIDSLSDAARSNEVADFLHEQNARLVSEHDPIVLVGAGHRTSYRYIHPESTVRAFAFSKGFRVNDDRVQHIFADNVLDAIPSSHEMTPDDIVLNSSMVATAQYFGLGNKVERKNRKRLHGGLFRGNVQDLSAVAESGTAMCMERASVAHNLAMLGGVASALVTGEMLIDGKEPQGHAFQMVSRNGTTTLFDPSNPSTDRRGDVLALDPTFIEIDPVDFLVGGDLVSTSLIRIDNEQPVREMEATYRHEASFPSTFEGFHELSFPERVALGELKYREIRARGMVDAANRFIESSLAAHYTAE